MAKGKVTHLEVLEYISVVLETKKTSLMDQKYCRYTGIIYT